MIWSFKCLNKNKRFLVFFIPSFFLWIVKFLFPALTTLLYVYANFKIYGSVKNITRTDLKQAVLIEIIGNPSHLILDILSGLYSAWFFSSENVFFFPILPFCKFAFKETLNYLNSFIFNLFISDCCFHYLLPQIPFAMPHFRVPDCLLTNNNKEEGCFRL